MEKKLLFPRQSGKSLMILDELMEGNELHQGDIKFLDKDGVEQAKIPAHSDLLNAIVGYNHDPQTHHYNRAERRRIIQAAKRLDKKYGKKGK